VAGVDQFSFVERPKYTVLPFAAAPMYWRSAARAYSETPAPSVALLLTAPNSKALTFER